MSHAALVKIVTDQSVVLCVVTPPSSASAATLGTLTQRGIVKSITDDVFYWNGKPQKTVSCTGNVAFDETSKVPTIDDTLTLSAPLIISLPLY